MINLKKLYLGALFTVLSAFGYGMMPIFAKYAYQYDVGVTTLLFIRFSSAALIFFTFILIKAKKVNITPVQIISLVLLGGVCYTLQSGFYFTALKYISGSLAVLILYTFPMFVAGLSSLIDREKLTIKTWISMVLCFAGLVLVLGSSYGIIDYRGVMYALAAAVVYSFYIVLGARVVQQLAPITTSAFVTLFSACSFILVGISTGSIQFNFGIGAWLPIMGIVVFSTVLAILMLFRGLELLGSTRASILSMMEPIFTIILSAVLLGEKLYPVQGIGGVAVLAGAVLLVSKKEKSGTDEQVEG